MRNSMTRAAAVVALLGAAAGAAAQDALGRGDALDGSLARFGGRRNPAVPDIADELRFRNSIVTGNAPGGLSLRADVGYLSPGEVDALLGTDTLFRFRRDSYYSGLAGYGIRGTDALQYQFALTTGLRPPPDLGGGVFLSRTAGDQQGVGEGGVMRSTGDITESDLSLWTLRSPAAYVSTQSMRPSLLAAIPGTEGERTGVAVSGLRGITTEPIGRVPTRVPESSDLVPRVRLPGLEESEASATERRDLARTFHDALLEQLGAGTPPPDAEGADRRPRYEAELDRIRSLLRDGTLPAPPAGEAERGGAADGARPVVRPDGSIDWSATALELVRGVQDPATALVESGFDAYTEHMARAQAHMGAGRYFDAEARFTVALSVRPGDAMAGIGRVHAQLGAGTLASAALNLSGLFVLHPELVGVRYAPSLLPGAERLAAVRTRLEQLVAREVPTTPSATRDAGLLLAYLGYQAQRRDEIERGLAAVVRDEGVERDRLDRLGALLREVWLAD